MKSVNTLLAWGHARVIENLLGKRYQMNPPPGRPSATSSPASKKRDRKSVDGAGQGIAVCAAAQGGRRHHVAAASILARDEFVKGLAKLEKQFEMNLPKGASAAVDAAAKKFVEERGAGELAKSLPSLHFRTALRA